MEKRQDALVSVLDQITNEQLTRWWLPSGRLVMKYTANALDEFE